MNEYENFTRCIIYLNDRLKVERPFCCYVSSCNLRPPSQLLTTLVTLLTDGVVVCNQPTTTSRNGMIKGGIFLVHGRTGALHVRRGKAGNLK